MGHNSVWLGMRAFVFDEEGLSSAPRTYSSSQLCFRCDSMPKMEIMICAAVRVGFRGGYQIIYLTDARFKDIRCIHGSENFRHDAPIVIVEVEVELQALITTAVRKAIESIIGIDLCNCSAKKVEEYDAAILVHCAASLHP